MTDKVVSEALVDEIRDWIDDLDIYDKPSTSKYGEYDGIQIEWTEVVVERTPEYKYAVLEDIRRFYPNYEHHKIASATKEEDLGEYLVHSQKVFRDLAKLRIKELEELNESMEDSVE